MYSHLPGQEQVSERYHCIKLYGVGIHQLGWTLANRSEEGPGVDLYFLGCGIGVGAPRKGLGQPGAVRTPGGTQKLW